MPRLVEFISDEFDDYPRLQFEAAWSLTNSYVHCELLETFATNEP